MPEEKVELDKDPELGIILRHFNKHKIDYVIIGGIAINAHLEEKVATADLDILVQGVNTPPNSNLFAVRRIIPPFDKEKTELGYTEHYIGHGFESFKLKFKSGKEWWLDCLCGSRYSPNYWFFTKSDAQKTKIAGVDCYIADLADIVIIKHGLERDKDIVGILAILESNKLNLDRFVVRVRDHKKREAVLKDLDTLSKRYNKTFPELEQKIKELHLPPRPCRKRLFPTRESKWRFIPDSEIEKYFPSLAIDIAGVISRRTQREEYPTVREIMQRVFPRHKWSQKAWRKVYYYCCELAEIGAIQPIYDERGQMRFRRYEKYVSRIGLKLKKAQAIKSPAPA